MTGVMPALLAATGRGRLPYASLHRSPLYLHALRSLAASGDLDLMVAVEGPETERVTNEVRRAGLVADVSAGREWWQRLREAGAGQVGLVVHDPLCPLTSADFIRSLRQDAVASPGVSLLAYRPVTDTVKTVANERIQDTIDREGLAALVSPAVLSPRVLAAALADDAPPPVDDFARLATWLRERGEVTLVRAPSLARRVDDSSAVNLLECVDEVARQVRREPAAAAAAVRGVSDATGFETR